MLVVEDEGPIRQALTQTLERFGYRVIEACSGPDALRQWEHHRERIDLVVTDMVMPEGLTGAELIDRLRVEKPGLPAIIASGYVPNQALAARSGVPMLSKPFDTATLLGAVRKCLEPSAGKSSDGA